MNDIVWRSHTAGYAAWSESDREAVMGFLRDHGIDPACVPVNDDNAIVVRVLPSGELEMETWVFDKVDGSYVRCPHCPSCVKQELVKRPLKTAVPLVPGAWVADSFTVDDAEVPS